MVSPPLLVLLHDPPVRHRYAVEAHSPNHRLGEACTDVNRGYPRQRCQRLGEALAVLLHQVMAPQFLHCQRRCQRWFFQLLTLNHHLLQEQCFRMQVDVQQRVLLQRQGEAERLIADVLHREQVIAPRQLIQRKETVLIAL